jgi:hypothetical protein
MSKTVNPDDPHRYVSENKDSLTRIIKHGNDEFVRALALAALVEYGSDPDLEELQREINHAIELEA